MKCHSHKLLNFMIMVCHNYFGIKRIEISTQHHVIVIDSSISSQTSIESMKRDIYIHADANRNSYMTHNKLLLDLKVEKSSM